MDEETIMQQLRRVRIAISRIEDGAQELHHRESETD